MSLLNGLHFPYYSPLYRGTKNANRLKRGWARAVAAANLHIEGQGRKIRVPKLSNVQIASEDGSQISAVVDMATVGETSRQLQNKIETVTASLHAYQTRVERIDPARSRITVSFSPPKRPRHDHSTDGALDLEQFPIHLDGIDHTEASIFLTKSILIGGEAESGKSNLVWYILSQMNDAQIPYRLWVIDPAGGVELSDLEHSPLTKHYVDRIGDIPTIVQKFRESMDERLSSMKRQGVRRHFPTPNDPLEILLIDELLLCKSQINKGDADSPLGEVLASGRKALHINIACTQLGQKDVIGQIRDLYPQRLCLRTQTQESTDAVLGTRATQDGAMCDRISRRGEGYVFTDLSGVFEKFQAPLVRETQSVAAGGITAPTLPQTTTRTLRRRSGRHFLYQFYTTIPDPRDPRRPAYVGITDNPRKRLKQHEKNWPPTLWDQIDHSKTRITAHANWDTAKQRETELIEYWQPVFNVQETR